ncbi:MULTISPECIES: hypothetical protein [unclassified Streptomyces]
MPNVPLADLEVVFENVTLALVPDVVMHRAVSLPLHVHLVAAG